MMSLKDAGEAAFPLDPLFTWIGIAAVDDTGREIVIRVEDLALQRLEPAIGGGAEHLRALATRRGMIFKIAAEKYKRHPVEHDESGEFIRVTKADIAQKPG
jgi:hypothetical protein